MAEEFVAKIVVTSSADTAGLTASEKAVVSLQSSADELISEINKLNSLTGEASPEKIARLRVALAQLEKQAEATGTSLDGLSTAQSALDAATVKATNAKIEAARMNLEMDVRVRRGLTSSQVTQKTMNELFGQGSTRAEGFARGLGIIGAAAAGGFATGMGIAKRAGVDFTTTFDALNSVVDSAASKLDWLVNKSMKMYASAAAALAGVFSKDLAQSLRDTAEGFDANIRANAANTEEAKRAAASVAAAEKAKTDAVVAGLRRTLELRQAELSALGETPGQIARVRDAELALARAQGAAPEELAALREKWRIEDVARQRRYEQELQDLARAATDARIAENDRRVEDQIATSARIEADRLAQAQADRDAANARIAAAQVEAAAIRTAAETAAAVERELRGDRRSEAERMLDDAAEWRDRWLAMAELTEADRLRIIQTYEAKVEAIRGGATRKQIEWAEMGAEAKIAAELGAASSVTGILRGAFADNKEIAIADAVMNMYLSAQRSFAAMSSVFPQPYWGVLAATAAIVAGYKNIEGILKADVGSGTSGAATPAPSFDDPTNDAAARFAGAASARDVAGHFGSGFREQLLKGTAHLASGNTAASMDSQLRGLGGGTTINVQGSFATPPREFVRAFTREQRKNTAIVESRVVRGRERVRR